VAANKIISKIEEEASKDKAKILSEAQNKADAIRQKILASAQTTVASIQVQAKNNAEEAGRRQVLIAELESRKKTLNSQREILEEVFTKVEDALNKLPQEQWEKLITSIILGASETGEEKLCVPAGDVAKYQNGFLAKLNSALRAAGKKGSLTLSDKAAKFKGGVELEGTTTDYDGSFTSILRDVRQKEERQIAAMLFGTEVK